MLKQSIPFIFVLLWSTGFIGTKLGLPYASAGDFLILRTLANIAIFAILLLILKQSRLNKSQIFHAMVTGLLIHGAYLGGVYSAIAYGVPAGLAAIIVGLQPLLTSVLAIVVFNTQLARIQWLALFIGLVGLVLVVASGLQLADASFWALAFAFIALFGITLGTLYQKRFCQQQAMLPSVCWQYIASLLVFAPMALFDGGRQVQWSGEFIFSLIWLVLVLSVAAILLLMYMVKQGDTAKVSAYFYLVPPATTIEAWLLFNEQLSLTSFFGMILCALSVYFVIHPKFAKAVLDTRDEVSQSSAT
ncbi:multidrug transporter [Thalassotalea insulae]|uniref:Multidrug transporter n=1 Tax=Thalassotalea insulae TaxID=2056778 RepID=A0ABQ6GVW3_9GAMM|nr:DMT family transporter [Thalassotalea insulae]GLX79829.1 multidrug transporter [Thalassotalea insulae]